VPDSFSQVCEDSFCQALQGSVPPWRGTRAQGEFVLGRLSQIAASAGARLAQQDCRPNFLVVLTPKPDRLLKQLKAGRPTLFGDGQPGQIHRFLDPSKPAVVRVWHNASEVNKDGVPVTGYGATCGGLPMAWMSNDTSVNCESVGSRIRWGALVAFSSVIVVVDTSLVKDTSFGQLADYVAMVGLADIDLDDDVGDVPTILRLFAASAETPPPGLTAWDRAFLTALYHTDQSSRIQRSQIAARMLHDVSP